MVNVQISRELFRYLCLYFLYDEDDSSELAELIREELNKKLDKVIARLLFSKYKRATTPFEREKFRKEYLEHIGMQRDFCTETEVRNIPPN